MMDEVSAFKAVENGAPLDGAAWRAAMGSFASGVVIVTTLNGAGQPVGTTVSAFSSVSLEPPLLLVCLDQKSRTRAAVQKAGHFCINILAAHQGALARLFAGPGATDRFANVATTPGVLGAPQIQGALVTVDCRLYALHAAGDHDILIGQGLRIEATPGAPLVYSQGRFLDH